MSVFTRTSVFCSDIKGRSILLVPHIRFLKNQEDIRDRFRGNAAQQLDRSQNVLNWF